MIKHIYYILLLKCSNFEILITMRIYFINILIFLDRFEIYRYKLFDYMISSKISFAFFVEITHSSKRHDLIPKQKKTTEKVGNKRELEDEYGRYQANMTSSKFCNFLSDKLKDSKDVI